MNVNVPPYIPVPHVPSENKLRKDRIISPRRVLGSFRGDFVFIYSYVKPCFKYCCFVTYPATERVFVLLLFRKQEGEEEEGERKRDEISPF